MLHVARVQLADCTVFVTAIVHVLRLIEFVCKIRGFLLGQSVATWFSVGLSVKWKTLYR